MLLSSGILLGFVLLFEVLLYYVSGGFGDLSTHMLNMADNTLAFVIGLAALDSVTYLNQVGRSKRDEKRAIIRHHRLLEPSIALFVARKNMMTTAPGVDVDQYTIRKPVCFADFQYIFDPSEISSDAGASRIAVYARNQTKLYEFFMEMVRDVDFAFIPEAGDAVMEFINATSYGSSSLESILAIEGNSVKRNAMVRAIKEAAAKDNAEEEPEVMTVYILMQTIRNQENALKKYLDAVEPIVK